MAWSGRWINQRNLILTGMENRPAPFLSGGQQQRASLARALVHEPKILFLDEPLSNLDAKLRTEMRLELKELVKRIGITTMYVTHDQIEALSMSDRIAVMHDGVIVEEGTPREIYLSPRSAFTAHFIGQTNVLEGRLTGQNDKDGHALVETACGRLALWANRKRYPARARKCDLNSVESSEATSGRHWRWGIKKKCLTKKRFVCVCFILREFFSCARLTLLRSARKIEPTACGRLGRRSRGARVGAKRSR